MRALVIVAIATGMVGRAGVCPVATFRARGVIGRACFESNSSCNPIPEVRVELLDSIGGINREVRADELGAFRVESKTAGVFTLRVSAEGFGAVECQLVARKTSKSGQRLKVVLGSDAILPCG